MPRPLTDVKPFKDDIVHWIVDEGIEQHEVRDRLRKAGCSIARSTLARRLSAWNVTVQPKLKDTPELRDRVTHAFQQASMTDKHTLQMLREDGIEITGNGLARLRRKMGLHKRIASGQEEEVQRLIREVLPEELESNMAHVKRHELHKHIRAKYHIVGRYLYLPCVVDWVRMTERKHRSRISRIAHELKPKGPDRDPASLRHKTQKSKPAVTEVSEHRSIDEPTQAADTHRGQVATQIDPELLLTCTVTHIPSRREEETS